MRKQQQKSYNNLRFVVVCLFAPCHIPEAWPTGLMARKGMGLGRLVLTWSVFANIVVRSTMVVTHAGNEPSPPRTF